MDGNYNIVSILKELVPKYIGIGFESVGFQDFLIEHNASDTIIQKFKKFNFKGELELCNGIIFSEKEIIVRNEFVSGDNVFIGINKDYEYIILNLKTSQIGFLRYEYRTKNKVSNKIVSWTFPSLEKFFIKQLKHQNNVFDRYLISNVFNTNVLAVMELISSASQYKFIDPPLYFKKWLSEVGFDDDFYLKKKVLENEMNGLFSFEMIMEMNPQFRMKKNPSFFVIGKTPDGGFIVLDRRTIPFQIGYVAIQEIGDEGNWENYYLKVSNDFGCFLHDLIILDILPSDYYQEKDFNE